MLKKAGFYLLLEILSLFYYFWGFVIKRIVSKSQDIVIKDCKSVNLFVNIFEDFHPIWPQSGLHHSHFNNNHDQC